MNRAWQATVQIHKQSDTPEQLSMQLFEIRDRKRGMVPTKCPNLPELTEPSQQTCKKGFEHHLFMSVQVYARKFASIT